MRVTPPQSQARRYICTCGPAFSSNNVLGSGFSRGVWLLSPGISAAPSTTPVDGLLDPLPAHLGQSQLEGLRLVEWDELDDP